MRKNTLTAGLKAAAGQQTPAASKNSSRNNNSRNNNTKAGTVAPATTVLIGGHFAPEVRRTLLLVQAEPKNTGKNLKQLLGEAINDLCAKYGKPQPYSGED